MIDFHEFRVSRVEAKLFLLITPPKLGNNIKEDTDNDYITQYIRKEDSLWGIYNNNNNINTICSGKPPENTETSFYASLRKISL